MNVTFQVTAPKEGGRMSSVEGNEMVSGGSGPKMLIIFLDPGELSPALVPLYPLPFF